MKPNQKPLPTIIDAMDDRELFAPWFSKRWLHIDTWFAWRVLLKGLYALPMNAAELEIFRKHTGRTAPLTEPFTKAWLICGRRGGKSRIAALVATYNSVFRKYPELQRGEVGVMPIIASDRKQADVIFSYVTNFFRDIPLLAKMVVQETKDSLWLSNNIRIEIQTSDHRSVRGFTMIGGVCDELAFWPSDEHSASPDVEILNALEKGSANVPGAMLLGVSSPYARKGALWEAYQRNYGKDTDELCWRADTRSMNPRISPRLVEKAYAKDPVAAAAEFGAEFRSDLADFLTLEAITACVVPQRYELAPRAGQTYYAFEDPSGGISDSMTLAIAHEERGTAVLDLLREVVSPFSPESVVKDFCADLKRYRVFSVVGDRWGAEWVVEQHAKNGVSYTQSEKPKSDLYLSLLPAVNSGQVELLDNKRLLAQLAGLERRTRSGGKDIVDHRPGLHDDLSNSCAGVLVLAGAGSGVFGVIEYYATGGAEAELNRPPATPRDDLIAKEKQFELERRLRRIKPPEEKPIACPACGDPLIAKVPGGQYRCAACGSQWWPNGKAPEVPQARRSDW